MSYAHETCCAHLKIQYRTEAVNGAFQGEVLGFWECASCRMLFAPQGRMPLPSYTPPELMPTNEECDQLAQDIWASRWSAARDTGIPVIRAWFADVTARIEREREGGAIDARGFPLKERGK